MKKLSKVICLVLSALMLLSLAACGKQGDGTGDTQGKPIEGGTFVYAIEEPITSLNWYNNSSTWDRTGSGTPACPDPWSCCYTSSGR